MSASAHSVAAFLALGSNLGSRLAHLGFAVDQLDARDGVAVEEASPVYEATAHTLTTGEHQPGYLNAAVKVRTDLSLGDLLDACHDIERAAGRDRRREARWAARTLDIDILVYGTVSVSTERITVPHPRMGARRFVLCPLYDLAPNLYVPAPYEQTVSDLLAACPDPDRPVRIEGMLR